MKEIFSANAEFSLLMMKASVNRAVQVSCYETSLSLQSLNFQDKINSVKVNWRAFDMDSKL